ncbi:cyclic peptide export ABC transporter [Magnetococcales bacterium HHB-1]
MFPAKKLLDFIDEESTRPKGRLIFLAILSGIANGILLAIINHAADLANQDIWVQLQSFALYIVVLLLFIYTKKYTLAQAVLYIEEILRDVRMRIANKIRHTELLFIENTGYAYIYNRLSQDTILISQSANVVFASLQAAIMLVFAMFYIAWLSWDGFLITVVAIAFGISIFIQRRRKILNDLNTAIEEEVLFFETLNHSLSGFKEVKINWQKNQMLYEHQSKTADNVQNLKSSVGVHAVTVMIFSQVFFYILIATIIFVWPRLESIPQTTVIKLTASVLFIIGPMDLLVGSLPLFMKSDVAVDHLRALEKMIDDASQKTTLSEQKPTPFHFDKIAFKDVRFHYEDSEGIPTFSIGPVNFTLNNNEILFIVGGNGSGKSTLLKTLVGLYYPKGGTIHVDQTLLTPYNYERYRELFSTIFTDFHLFDRLYGLEDIDPDKVNQMIHTMGLENKTHFHNERFSNIQLSTGQRKRIAYIAATLEDKTIYMFDEWAADQDPTFRQYFYETLLPDLKAQGKTIIAVTHDDKYFYAADRVLKMEEGQLIQYDQS